MLLGTGLSAPGTAADLPALHVPGWERVPHLAHGFLTRHGGVSRGPFAALNLSTQVGDDAEAVAENWRRVAAGAAVGLRIATMRQVHGATVVSVHDDAVDAGEADGIATRGRGLVLGVLTADCVPILLVAPAHGVVAAVHAGWRGTVAGVTARMVDHLATAFAVAPSDVFAALGPSIGGCCYETDDRVADQLEQQWGSLPGVVRERSNGKVRLDLRQANGEILVRCSVPRAQLSHIGPCTQCAADDFFSHRGGRGRAGRQLSFIGWRAGTGADT